MTGNSRSPWTVRTEDGVVLGGDHLVPEGPVVGTMVALHAMMADRRSMDRPAGQGFVEAFVQAGWRVLLADFRGRGSDTTARAWRYEDLVRHDVPAWVRAARSFGDGPVGVVGHSLGGHVTAASIAEGASRPDLLLLVAANTWMPSLEPSWRRRLLKRLSVGAFAGAATLVGRFPARRLRIGPVDESSGYARDLARPMWTGRWRAHDGTDWWEGWGRNPVPAAAWVATGDTLLAHPAGAAAFARHGGASVYVVGDGGCGVAGRPGHMDLVTDPANRPAWAHMARWASGVAVSRAVTPGLGLGPPLDGGRQAG